MGRKGNWFSSVKKAFSPDSKDKKNKVSVYLICIILLVLQDYCWCYCVLLDIHHAYLWSQRANKSKKLAEKEKSSTTEFSTLETVSTPQHLPPPPEVQTTEVVDEQAKYAYSVEDANTSSYVPAVQAPEVVAETVQPMPVTRFTGMSREEVATIKIQTTFRGYLVYIFVHALFTIFSGSHKIVIYLTLRYYYLLCWSTS